MCTKLPMSLKSETEVKEIFLGVTMKNVHICRSSHRHSERTGQLCHYYFFCEQLFKVLGRVLPLPKMIPGIETDSGLSGSMDSVSMDLNIHEPMPGWP